jgi:hypothetical protein
MRNNNTNYHGCQDEIHSEMHKLIHDSGKLIIPGKLDLAKLTNSKGHGPLKHTTNIREGTRGRLKFASAERLN